MTVPAATFITEFFEDFHRMNKPLPGNTKTDAARNEASFNGLQQGLRHGLCYYANELRRQKVRALNLPDEGGRNWIPALAPNDFITWTRSVRERWEAGTWKEVTDAEYMALMTEEFLSITFDEDWHKYYDAVRKDAVKAGLVEPTEADAEWIAEEYKAYSEMVKPYDLLLQKLGKKVGFQGRPVKDTPQA